MPTVCKEKSFPVVHRLLINPKTRGLLVLPIADHESARYDVLMVHGNVHFPTGTGFVVVTVALTLGFLSCGGSADDGSDGYWDASDRSADSRITDSVSESRDRNAPSDEEAGTGGESGMGGTTGTGGESGSGGGAGTGGGSAGKGGAGGSGGGAGTGGGSAGTGGGGSSMPEAFIGIVRSDNGNFYAVDSKAGVTSKGGAGWDLPCPEGTKEIGRQFESNGFWFCARLDLADRTFYVGNVVSDNGNLYGVEKGKVTHYGAWGWVQPCPAGSSFIAKHFESNGFWVCID